MLVDTLSSAFVNIVLIVWWVMLPLVLVVQLLQKWPDWLVWKHLSTYKYAVLEIMPPPEVLKTPKAMESVLIGLGGSWAEENFRDKWWRGKHQDSFNLELVAHNGTMRFFVRCKDTNASWVESKVYSEYPDAQIIPVEDYVASLPEYAPNAHWDIWGAAYSPINKDWTIPIATYLEWEDQKDERRMSPLSQFGELATQLGPYEYVLFQINISPRKTEYDDLFEKSVKKITGEKIEEGKKKYAFVGELLYGLFEFASNAVRILLAQETVWRTPEEEEKKEARNLLWSLTPKEQKVLEAIQFKQDKLKFETAIYTMYLFRRDHAHKERISDMNGFFGQFDNLNGLKPTSKTYPSSNASYLWWRKDKINLQRMRRLYFAYKARWEDMWESTMD